jgi:hypothetical protein
MSTDNNSVKDPGSGKTSVQEVNEMEEVINLVDALSENDGQMEKPEGESTSSGTEEGSIDLADVVEESAEGASDDEQLIELVDQVDAEAHMEEENLIQLTDVVEDQDSQIRQERHDELPDADVDADDSEEDTPLEYAGLETAEEGSYAAVEELAAEESVAIEEGAALEEAVEPSAPYTKEGPPSAPAGPSTDEALESMIRDRLSEEKIEAVIRGVVTQTIEKKADRILLEVAEAAIAKEIERLKQVL